MNVAEMYVTGETEKYDVPEIAKAVELIQEYRATPFYQSKQTLLDSWNITDKSIRELVISVFTCALQEDYLTLQAIAGKLNHKIDIPDEEGRLRIIGDVIGLVSLSKLISIESQTGDYHKIRTEYVMKDVPEPARHVTQRLRPQPIDNNKSDELGHMIIGHVMNRHNKNIRLDHYNRMTQIPFRLNQDFINKYEEAPKNWPDTGEKEDQWEYFKEKSSEKYKETGTNVFYIPHKPDSRGRSYCRSYYMDPQGNSYKKAAIQLANAEVVEGI
jgi:hypothetical protein